MICIGEELGDGAGGGGGREGEKEFTSRIEAHLESVEYY